MGVSVTVVVMVIFSVRVPRAVTENLAEMAVRVRVSVSVSVSVRVRVRVRG